MDKIMDRFVNMEVAYDTVGIIYNGNTEFKYLYSKEAVALIYD